MVISKDIRRDLKNMTQQKNTFTTAAAMAKACQEAQKHIKKGEDVRKVYPLEGTGRGGRWLSVMVGVEVCNADTGEPIGELWIDISKDKDPRNTRHGLSAALRFARDF